MTNQPIQNQQNLSPKQTMTNFIHDVADMETRAFTLREAAKKVRSDAGKKRFGLEYAINQGQIVMIDLGFLILYRAKIKKSSLTQPHLFSAVFPK